ncbi:putative F-box protein-like [Capsicum annuum]|nr:putative F-box protein-like [Capsicum annuum]
MAQNDIDDVLDQLRRIKRGGDLSSVKVDQIETLEMEIRFFRIFSKYNHFLLPNSIVKITKKARRIVKMLHSVYDGIPDEFKTNLNVERLESHLLEFIDGDTSLRHNYVLNVSDLLEYMDCLDKNLNDVRMCTNGHMFLWINRFIKQLKTIQKKMRFLRYLYVSEINENVDHEKLQGLKIRIQFMADNVGKLWFFFWVYEDENDKDEDVNDILSKPPYLLFLVVIVELEMQKIFLGELETSKFSQSRTFSDRKLPKGFSYNLCKLLVYLSNEKLKNFLANVTGRNIDVEIEFLLLFLGDVPNHVINGKKLNKFLVNIGVLVGDILCVTQMLLSGSTIKEDAIKIDLSPMQILEKIEDLKAQVGTCYKSLKFTPSHEFPMVGGLSFLHSLLRKLNEMLKSETGFNFMMKPHIGILEKEISSLASVFRDGEKVKREHKILEDSWKHIINLAYEAELAIDFILSQCNTLWHSFCSLPAIIKEITHINVEVTQMRPVNLAQMPCCAVEPFKHLQTRYRNPVNDKEIVGFGNDTKNMIQYLVGGTNELDVLPIVGMGGQGKTTIARKVFNSNVIINHFDARAWCIISQTYDRSYLLQEIFRQVTNSRET